MILLTIDLKINTVGRIFSNIDGSSNKKFSSVKLTLNLIFLKFSYFLIVVDSLVPDILVFAIGYCESLFSEIRIRIRRVVLIRNKIAYSHLIWHFFNFNQVLDATCDFGDCLMTANDLLQ